MAWHCKAFYDLSLVLSVTISLDFGSKIMAVPIKSATMPFSFVKNLRGSNCRSILGPLQKNFIEGEILPGCHV